MGEKFWSAMERTILQNYVTSAMTMRETFVNLQEGWNGNIHNWESMMEDNPYDYW
jgi:hypothetical protein